MNRTIEWFARNSVAANLMMMVIVLSGIATMPTIVQELIPEIELEYITVTTPYPGGTPGDRPRPPPTPPAGGGERRAAAR